MEIERWKLVDDLLQSALELAPEERDEFLERSCADDPEAIEEVRSLLTSHRRAGSFLETPAMESAAGVIAAEAEPIVSERLVGQVVSHYRLLRKIGQGGMGSVWLAERCDGRFERKVAIKFIHLAVLDQVSAERFKREGAILGKLAHPQIAELIDAGVTSIGEPFLVLEYVEGLAVDAYCDKNKLSIDARIRLYLDVLSGVAHAHGNLIVHRDIKPSNVLVSNQGQVKLLDFGIAKVLADKNNVGSSTDLTQEGDTVLTPRFAAPEQVTNGTITTGTDVYALGVLLYLILTGQHPAGPGPHSTAQLIKSIVEGQPLRISEAVLSASPQVTADRGTTPELLRRRLRGDLDRILEKATKKNSAERYLSVTAFAYDLKRHLEHKPILARPDSFRYRTSKFVRRNWVAVSLAAVAFIGLCFGGVGVVLQNRRIRAERDFALRQLVRVNQHDEVLEFLLSDAAPSGKPLTVNDLLDRARHILERQKPSSGQLDLLEWVGEDYIAQDQQAKARSILEHAYQMSRYSTDRGLRASGSCTFATVLARNEDLERAEALIQEGLRELPNDSRHAPEYVLTEIGCLRQGAQVAQQGGKSDLAVHRMEAAQQLLRASPFDTDELEMGTSLDLASAYSDAGQDRNALAQFQRAGALMTSLGRDDTGTAIALYNNWALELQQIGHPLDAEKLFRKVIDISRDNPSEESVSPMVLVNVARVYLQLNQLDQAADYSKRGYDKAVKTGDEVVINQSLILRSRIYLAQHNPVRATAMLDEVEPRLRKTLPPGHYGFASIDSSRALIAMENQNLPSAQRWMDEAVETLEATVRAGGQGVFGLPDLYTERSAINLAAGRAEQAEADAGHALAALQTNLGPDDVSSKLGQAYLAEALALTAESKPALARAAAERAVRQLELSVGKDHPDTQSARKIAR